MSIKKCGKREIRDIMWEKSLEKLDLTENSTLKDFRIRHGFRRNCKYRTV